MRRELMFNRLTRSIGAGALVVALVCATAASGASSSKQTAAVSQNPAKLSPAVIAAAKQEGTVNLYTSASPPAVAAITSAFKAEYGLTINAVYLGAEPLTVELNAGFNAHKVLADAIITSDDGAVHQWQTKNYLTRLPVGQYPTPSKYNAPVELIPQGIYYNKKLVKKSEVPTSYEDLLSRRWKGEVALGNANTSPAYALQYLWILRHEGASWFKKIAALQPRIESTAVLVPQAVESGAAEVGLVGLPQFTEKSTNPSGDLAVAWPKIVTAVNSEVAVPVGAADPAAARLFAQWMMTQRGQTIFNAAQDGASPLGSLPGTLHLPKGTTVSPLKETADNTTVYAQINSLFSKDF
jgi:ABC-type Fe3+ transport system substrate-binding protein